LLTGGLVVTDVAAPLKELNEVVKGIAVHGLYGVFAQFNG